MKKISSLIVVLLLISLIGGHFSYATDEKSIENTNNDNTSEYFTDQEIIKLSDYYIQQYLNENYSNEKNEYELANEFIKLYDTNNNHFAYFIRFNTVNDKHNGYLTLGAIKNGLTFYEISEDINFTNSINEYETSRSSKQIIFLPPMQYYTKDTIAKSTEYKIFGETNKDVSVSIDNAETNLVSLDNDSYINIYDKLKSEEFKRINMSILNDDITVEALRGPTGSVYLSKWLKYEFLPIVSSLGTHYGGNQNWMPSPKNKNGCGPTAAANIFAYLYDKNNSKYGKLYSYSDFKYSSYKGHMIEVYDYMSPVNPWYGLISINDFGRYVVDLAIDKGYGYLYSSKLSAGGQTKQATIDFIKGGLRKDTPIACLNLQKIGYDYGWHWMTITVFRDLGDYQNQVRVSTWGQYRDVNFYALYLAASQNGGGYIYFE